MTAPAEFTVRIGRTAARDIRDIATYLAQHASRDVAREFTATLLERIESLRHFALRGSMPPELQAARRPGYRQILFGRYRVIYRTRGAEVVIVLVADGRRDMQALLGARLIVPPDTQSDPPA